MNKSKWWQRVILLVVVVLLDQWVKFGYSLRGDVVMNDGGIWGILPGWGGWGWLLLIWVVAVVMWFKAKKVDLQWWGWGFVVAGGLSNLIDRWMRGSVVDMIYYPWLKVYGNIADVMIGVGVILVLIDEIRKYYKNK